MSARTPPFPGKDIALWARQLHNYLVGESQITQRVEPTAILLAHKKDAVSERATTDGIMLFDPVAKVPVFSKDGGFVPIGGGGAVPAFATEAEALAGVSTNTIISPATLDAVIDDLPPPPVVPAFATTAEAIAGTVNNKIMSPALVQARGGFQAFALAGLSTVTFNQIPQEATEIALQFSFASYSAGGIMWMDFSGNTATRVWSSRHLNAATYIAPFGDEDNTLYVIDNDAAAQSVSGLLNMARDVPGGIWYVAGNLRRRANSQLTLAGLISLSGVLTGQLRITCNAPFTAGSVTARWRI